MYFLEPELAKHHAHVKGTLIQYITVLLRAMSSESEHTKQAFQITEARILVPRAFPYIVCAVGERHTT